MVKKLYNLVPMDDPHEDLASIGEVIVRQADVTTLPRSHGSRQ